MPVILPPDVTARQQWKMLLLTMGCYLFFYTGRHNFGWASKGMATELNISYGQIGWISFAMLMGYAVGQLINGNFADRLSPKRMIATGGLLSVLANILISYSHSFPWILLLWTLNGYFQSLAWAAGGRIIANWWEPQQRGLAFGLYTMAAASSSVITYLFSLWLVHENWRNVFRLPVLLLLLAIIPFFLFVKDRPGSTQKLPGTAPCYPLSWVQAYRTVFQNTKFLSVCLSIGFQSMARYGLIFWAPLYFMNQEAGETTFPEWLSVFLPIGMTAGAASFGFIADRLFKANRVASISSGMLACGFVSLIVYAAPVQHPLLIAILMFAAGFFSYGPQANFWPLAPAILGNQLVGTGMGIMNMTAYFFAALGEPLMGKLLDIFHSKGIIFLTIAFIAFVSAITIWGSADRKNN